jgi:hypothetical protein
VIADQSAKPALKVMHQRVDVGLNRLPVQTDHVVSHENLRTPSEPHVLKVLQ